MKELPKHLINDDGSPFEASELNTLRDTLDALDDAGRTEYRNQNASAIARRDTAKFLIVSGPGTGKSYLFLEKINYWYQNNQNAKVAVTSFVRKLVADLQSDIESDGKLTDKQKGNITASTLHKYARSLVEKNRGTKEWPFKPHFRMIGQSWKEIVWSDVLAFFSKISHGSYTWKIFEKQLHDNNIDESEELNGLKKKYFKLCQFYNAAGFADLILHATKALEENSSLNENDHFIIDEYQDFNLAEEALINRLVDNPKGLLVVGDDEQVLYEKLKSGKSTLIRNLYRNTDYANGMLPYCSRSSYHITKNADHFIRHNRDTDCIDKIYLPLKSNGDEQKVQVVACATAKTAVDYIEKFVKDHKTEIDERKMQLEAGKKKDAFLLILTPAREVKFYGDAKKRIENIVANYQTEVRSFSEDYYRLLNYYSVSKSPRNNFTFRKVLHHEGVAVERVHELIVAAMQNKKNLCDLNEQEIKDVVRKCRNIMTILDSEKSVSEKLDQLSEIISLAEKTNLQSDLERKTINQNEIACLEHKEDEEAELEEIEVKRMGAVEFMTIVGSKGLSSDHVIIIGFDDVNMKYVTKNAFYVAMTRARKSLHLLTALKSGGAKGAHHYLEQLSDEFIACYSYKKTGQVRTYLSCIEGFKKYLNRCSSWNKGKIKK
ncbi:MAG: UvrD-helicase domain-containing protein [Pseudomonadota bacterium]